MEETACRYALETGNFAYICAVYVIMTIEYRNAVERFDKPILSAFANSNK